MIDTVDQIKTLEAQYILTKPDEVARFLQLYSYLMPLLQEARQHIANAFPDSDVRLQVVTDPEIPGYVSLFGYILTALNWQEAGQRLDQFDRGWFLPHFVYTQGRLNFDVDFI